MNLANRILYTFIRSCSALACALGPTRSRALGVGFADAVYGLYRISPARRMVANHILAAYPDWERHEADALAHAHLRQLLRSIVEVLRFPVMDARELSRMVRWEGHEHLEAALARGKGAIILSAHFGNWELMAAAISSRVPLSVLVQPASQGAFDRLFIEYRAMHGVTTYANTGPVSLRPAMRALARNEAVGMLCDQHGESQEAIGMLFDHPVSVPMGAFYLARKTGAALLPTFIERQANGTHRLVVEGMLPVSGDRFDAQAYCDRLEARIRSIPDHWLWVHDRWAREAELRPLEARREALP